MHGGTWTVAGERIVFPNAFVCCMYSDVNAIFFSSVFYFLHTSCTKGRDFFGSFQIIAMVRLAKFLSFSLRGKGHNMPRLFLPALLAVTSVLMQTQTTTQGTEKPKPVQTASIATPKAKTDAITSTTPVITIHGLCSTPAATKDACTTVITRQQFDVVTEALGAIGQSPLPMQKHGIAQGYASTLINYEAAKKAGVEKDPRFAEVMRLARMRAMGEMYSAVMTEKAKKVSPEEIQAYYKQNTDKLEELTLRRVTLPKYNSANLKDEEFAVKAAKIAADIHDRAASGEDMDKLQAEAYEKLGIKGNASTKMAVVRRGVYSPDQEQQLFALKPGEVTRMIEQPSAFIIFKLENRKTPTLAEAKDEISRKLFQAHLDKEESTVSNSIKIDYNEEYIGAAPTSAWVPASQLNASPDSRQPKADGPEAHKTSSPK